MAFDQREKAYLNNIKSSLTEEQWAQLIELTDAEEKAQLIASIVTAVIDTDLSSLNLSIANIDIEKAQRLDNLNQRISELTALKAKVQVL